MSPPSLRRLTTVTSWLTALAVVVGCASTHSTGRPAPSASKSTRPSSARASAPARPDRPVDAAATVDEVEIDRRVRAHAAFAAGVVSQLNDDSEAALQHFERALAADPNNDALLLDVARRRLQRQQFDQAVELLQRAARRPGVTPAVLSYLGLTQVQLGRTEEAIATYREALRRMPESLASAGMLAQLLAEKQKADEAFDVLRTIAKQPSTDARFWVDLADLFQQQGVRSPSKAEAARQESLAALQKARELSPNEPAIVRRLADRFFDIGRLDEAETLYRRLRDLAPRDAFPLARLADIYLRRGATKQATEQLVTLQRESPTDPLPPYYLGLMATEEGQFEKALELFERSVLLGPDFEPAYLDLATTHLALNQPKEAQVALEKRSARFKATFRSEYLAGMAAVKLRDFDAALRRFTDAELRAKADQPSALDHRFYFQIGATYERAQRREEATQYLLKALEKKADFPEALNHLGYMWAERGENLERAHEMIRKAVELEPENEAFLDSLGWVLFKLGKPADALPWLEKSARLSEKPDPTILDHLGDVLAALGRWKDAVNRWTQSVALEPSEAIREKIHNAAGR